MMIKWLTKREVIKGLLLLIFLIFLVLCFLLTPRIVLKGKTKIVLNIHSAYKEPGYRAWYFGKDVTSDVITSGEVDTDREGKYEIIYIILKNKVRIQAKRVIEVKDRKAPEITLLGKKNTKICPGTIYQEEGYTAIDNVDGDVSKNVKVKRKKDRILYQVQDKKGNKKQMTRYLEEKDEVPPSIILLGGKTIFSYLGEPFHDPGYQAIDHCDGDLSDKVMVSGEIDINQLGEQTLTYQVEDASHNKKEERRTVHLIEHGTPGTIYLTFDDGPGDNTTSDILDILKEENVKATFFVTGRGEDSLIKREYDEGHTVGLHTFSHNYGTVYASMDSYFDDLNKVSERVKGITGTTSRIIRFPGGSSNTISRRYQEKIMSQLTEEVIKRGYFYYDWNLDSGDAGGAKSSEDIYQNVILHLSKERVNIILMHDIKPYTKDALRSIIQYGKENGYYFDKITEKTEMVRQRVNN